MAPDPPTLNQLTLVVQDMEATLAFYRRLGLATDAKAGAEHVEVGLPNGMRLEFDTAGAVHQWDSGWRGETGGSSVLGFSVRSREAVDELYRELIGAGYPRPSGTLRRVLGRSLCDR